MKIDITEKQLEILATLTRGEMNRRLLGAGNTNCKQAEICELDDKLATLLAWGGESE